MTRFTRLVRIGHVVSKYRLDQLLDQQRIPWPMRLALAPAALYGKCNLERGERIRCALQDLGPIFIKFGQLLSTRPDLVAPDICVELDKLQDRVPPFDSSEFRAIVEQALGDSTDNLFQEFSAEPLASASVAQVHTAKLPDGKEVVVKAIRPGIENTIHQDLSLLYTLARILSRYSADGRRLRPLEVVSDYEKVIYDELDLQCEGANASLLRHNFTDSDQLYVPEIYWPYSNHKVLVMERIRGIPVTDLAQLHEKNVNFRVLAERGVEIFFTQVFNHNFFHADMHPGNIFVDASKPESPSYLAVDCAIMGTLSREDLYYLARNLIAIFRRDYHQVAELHVQSGWVPEGTPVHEFASAIRTVCEPAFQRPISEISLGHMLINLFGAARRFDMQVQPSLILLQKTLLNIEGLGRQLYPQLDLWQTAHPFLEKWLGDRYTPGSIADELKRHGPDWLEQFPQVPQLVFQSLQKLQNLDRTLAASAAKKDGRKSRLARYAGAAITGTGLGMAIPYWSASLGQLPATSLLLIVAGVLLLALR